MSRAIAARIDGDDYQARLFWIQACRLFMPSEKVVRVGYEDSTIKSFDDIVVHYEGRMDDDGNPLLAEYYQVKFHVTSGGAVTWKSLMDASFINADSVSFLQRLKNAQKQFAPNGTESHFILYSPWQIHPDDPLATIHSSRNGSLDWHRLATGGSRSKKGQIRDNWRKHLQIEEDAELRLLLRPLRILVGKNLQELNKELNDKLHLVGLKPVEEGTSIHDYEGLARNLIKNHKTDFDCSDIQEICRQAGLWVKTTSNPIKNYLVERQEKLDEELKISNARCINRYRALGLNKNDAIDLLESLKVSVLSNIYSSSESLTLLIGEMGTGKSLIAELLLQQAIEKAQKDKDAPYPIYLTIECIKESKSLKKAISDSAEGICDIKKQKILVVIDSPDELGMSFANKQLEDARTLVRS